MYVHLYLLYNNIIFYFHFVFFSELAFGSIITLKNARAGGALLHSHTHLYPKEHPPEQQQVNGFAFNSMHSFVLFSSLWYSACICCRPKWFQASFICISFVKGISVVINLEQRDVQIKLFKIVLPWISFLTTTYIIYWGCNNTSNCRCIAILMLR